MEQRKGIMSGAWNESKIATATDRDVEWQKQVDATRYRH